MGPVQNRGVITGASQKTKAFQDTDSALEKPNPGGVGTGISVSWKVVSPCFVLVGCLKGFSEAE